jgi:hypothetical protein
MKRIITEQINWNKSKENSKKRTREKPVEDSIASTVEGSENGKWKEVSGDYLDKLKAAGEKVKEVGGKWYHKVSDKISSNNTLDSTLPDWTKQYTCLSDIGKVDKTTNENQVVGYGDDVFLFFFKNKTFIYEKKDKSQIKGTWDCVSNNLIIKTEDGEQWSKATSWKKQSSGSSNTQVSDDSTIYKTPGDPYQYKVVNGEWFTKSLENRGKIIPDWISLANNVKATNILDSRFPDARKKIEVKINDTPPVKTAEPIKKDYEITPDTDLIYKQVDVEKDEF